jgi:hypothetical protein
MFGAAAAAAEARAEQHPAVPEAVTEVAHDRGEDGAGEQERGDDPAGPLGRRAELGPDGRQRGHDQGLHEREGQDDQAQGDGDGSRARDVARAEGRGGHGEASRTVRGGALDRFSAHPEVVGTEHPFRFTITPAVRLP